MFGINVEYKQAGDLRFPKFVENIKGKSVLAVADVNTEKYLLPLLEEIKSYIKDVEVLIFPDEELVPDEPVYDKIAEKAKGKDWLLMAGSGTLNDLGKYVGSKLGIKNSTLATAPSMDGYISTVAAIMTQGKKVTLPAQSPSDVLIDADILAESPSFMIGAGIGDIIGKYNSLLDWRMANLKNGEPINEESVALTLKAVDCVLDNMDKILEYNPEGMNYLMDALITSGYAMVIAGNSRPASGGEHHTSHWLEMDYVKKGLPVPLHGIKVGLGTLVCITLYRYLKENNVKFNNSDAVYAEVDKLPKEEDVIAILKRLNTPTKYREIGVSEELLSEMLFNAYTVRERYTILSLCRELDVMKDAVPMLVKKYW